MKVYITRSSGKPLLPKKYDEFLNRFKAEWDRRYAIMDKQIAKLPQPTEIPWYIKFTNKLTKKQVALKDLTDIAFRKGRKKLFQKFQSEMRKFEKALNKEFRWDFEVEMEHTQLDEVLKEFPGQATIGLNKTKKALLLIVNG